PPGERSAALSRAAEVHRGHRFAPADVTGSQHAEHAGVGRSGDLEAVDVEQRREREPPQAREGADGTARDDESAQPLAADVALDGDATRLDPRVDRDAHWCPIDVARTLR